MRAALRRPRRVLIAAAVFLVVALAGGLPVVGSLLPGGMVAPSAESTLADYTVEVDFDGARENLLLLVRTDKGVSDPGVVAAGQELTRDLQAMEGIRGALSPWVNGDQRLVSEDELTALVLIASERPVDEVEAELVGLEAEFGERAGSTTFTLGGPAAVDLAIGEVSESDLLRTELVALPLTVIALVLVFRGLYAAGLPLVIGGLSIAGAMLVMNLLSQFIALSVYALNLGTALGLALGVDYSLLIVRRYREELAARAGSGDGVEGGAAGVFSLDPAQIDQAIRAAMRTAGHTVVVSGLCLIGALCSLLVFDQFFLRSFVYAGVSVVAIAMVAAMVVLPALLKVIGPRINRLNVLRPVRTGRWERWAGLVVRHRVVMALGALLVLVVLSIPALSLRPGLTDVKDLPADHQVSQVAGIVEQQFPDYRGSHSVVLIGLPPGWLDEEAVDDYAVALSELEGVTGVEYAQGLVVDGVSALPADQYTETRFIRPDQTWLRVSSNLEDTSDAAVTLLDQIRALDSPGTSQVGGPTAATVDTKADVADRLWLAGVIIVVGSLLILLVATGGVLVAVKAVALNLLTFGAVIGFLVWGIQQGNLNGPLGTFQEVTTTDLNALILVLVIIYGLSLDYEVFLLTRVREFHLAGLDSREAVVQGLARTGGTITSAALIMLVVLAGLTVSQSLSLKLIGAGLSFAIIVDAVLVRCMLVPALLSLAGRWNWWAPAPLQRWRAAAFGRWLDGDDTPEPVAPRRAAL